MFILPTFALADSLGLEKDIEIEHTIALINSEEYQAGYKRGEKVGSAYGEMFGIISGVIYGHAIYNPDDTFCLIGSPKEKVRHIAQALFRLTESGVSLEYNLSDVPTKASSLRFMRENFSCE